MKNPLYFAYTANNSDSTGCLARRWVHGSQGNRENLGADGECETGALLHTMRVDCQQPDLIGHSLPSHASLANDRAVLVTARNTAAGSRTPPIYDNSRGPDLRATTSEDL